MRAEHHEFRRNNTRKITIMTDILILVLNCSCSDAYEIISSSDVYKILKENNYPTVYDSPQANLSMIGQELRLKNNPVGNIITDENIKRAMQTLKEA